MQVLLVSPCKPLSEVSLDASKVGQFYAGDSYLVSYSYQAHGKTHYIIYFWLGAHSSADETGAAAILAAKMDDELGGAATQVRVTMGKEPSHFVQIFRGRMVVHSGGTACVLSAPVSISGPPSPSPRQ